MIRQRFINARLRFERWRKMGRARHLIRANQRDLDGADCGFALRDHLAGGRLSRREDQARALVEQCKEIDAYLEGTK